jgi:hypothetical protein
MPGESFDHHFVVKDTGHAPGGVEMWIVAMLGRPIDQVGGEA